MADDFDKDELSWLSNDNDENNSENPEDELDFDWLKGTDELPPMQNKVTKRLGITGDLDWQKASSESTSSSRNAQEDDSFDWGIFDRAGDSTHTGAPRASGLTGQLPWMQRDVSTGDKTSDAFDAVPSFEEQVRRAEQSAGLSPTDDTDVPDWLSEIEPPELPPIEDEAVDEETFNTAWFASLESELEQVAAEADPLPNIIANDSNDAPETDWLAYMAELDDVDRREAEFFTQAAAEAPDEPTVDWLQDFTLEPLAEEDEALVNEPTKVEKPSWLLDLEAGAQAQQQTQAQSQLFDDLDALASLFDDSPVTDKASHPLSPATEPDSDFDLFGQLAQEADSLGELDINADADSAMFAALFGDDSPAEAVRAPQQEEPAEDLFDALDLLGEDEKDYSVDAFEAISEPLLKDDVASWLQEIQTLDHAVNHETAPTTDIDDLDSFLASISVDPAPPPSGPLSSAAVDDFDALFADERLAALDARDNEADEPQEPQLQRPEWLKNVRVGEISATALVRKQQDRPLEELPADLLALREETQKLPSASVELATASIVTPLVPSASDALRLTDAQKSNAKRLAALASGEAEASRQSIRNVTRRFPLGRLLIAALLVAALIAPYYVDDLRIGDAPPLSFAADSPQQAVFTHVDSLAAGERVLLAAEYSGTGTGELDDLTRVLLAHLAARGASITLASTTPTGYLHGTRLAQNAVDNFNAVYIPNSVMGLRDFAQTQKNLTNATLDDFALIVVIAESADTVRAWAEQVEPQTRTPLAYVTSAAAAPFALPYAQSKGALGALVGYRDAYAYAAQLEQALVVVPLRRVDRTSTPESVTPAQETPFTLEPTQADSTPAPTIETTPKPTLTPTQAETTPTQAPSATPEPTQAEVTPTPTTEAASEPTPVPSVPPQATAALERFAIVTAPQAVNVRQGPGQGFAIVGLLQPNDRVRIVSENEDGSWYEIEFGANKQRGWIASFLVTIEIVPGAYRPPLQVQVVGLVSDISQASPPPDVNAPAPTLIAGGEDRWYSTTLGLITAIVVIVVGNLLGLLRRLRKR